MHQHTGHLVKALSFGVSLAASSLAFQAGAMPSASTEALERLRSSPDYPSYEFLPTSDGDTHYQDIGPSDAPVVVLVHGVSGPLNVWDRNVEPLLDAGFRVVRYDMYGRGLSSRLDGSTYDLSLFLRQLEDLLAGLAIQGPVRLVGSSFGAVVASEFALQHPERVLGLVLVGPAGTPIRVSPLAGVQNWPVVGGVLTDVLANRLILEQNRKYFVDRQPPPEFWRLFTTQLSIPGTADAMRATLNNTPVRNYLQPYRDLARLNIPVGLIWGRDDVTFPFANHEILQEAIPAARLVAIDAAGHLPQYERADETNAALLPMLKDLPPESAASSGHSPRLSFSSAVDTRLADDPVADDTNLFDTAGFFAPYPQAPEALELAPGIVKTYLFPTYYAGVTTAMSVHSCDLEAARRLVGDPDLEPVKLGAGRAAVIFTSYRYGHVRGMAPYSEVAVAIPVVRRGQWQIPVAALLKPEQFHVGASVVWMPVTTLENRIRGRQIWGLPKDVTPISLREVGSDLVTTVLDDQGEVVFSLAAESSGVRRALSSSTVLYSRKDGVPLEAASTSEGAYVVHQDAAAIAGLSHQRPRLSWGPSPAAERWRALKIDPVAIKTQVGRDVKSVFAWPSPRRL